MIRYVKQALLGELQHSNMPRLRGILKSRKNLQDIGTSSFRVGRLLTPASFVWCMLKWIIWIIWVIWSMTALWSFFPRENDKETLQTVSDRFSMVSGLCPFVQIVVFRENARYARVHLPIGSTHFDSWKLQLDMITSDLEDKDCPND